MVRERINWPVVAAVTITGLGALAIGLWLGDATAETWSSVFIEIGVAVGLLSVLVVLERRVVRRVAASTAREEVESVAADLRGRIERLEDVDAVQEQERSEQRQLARTQTEAIRTGNISSSSVGNVIVEAVRDRLLDPDFFHVRTSNQPLCPVLYMLPFIDPKRVIAVYLDFEPFELDDQPVFIDNEPVPVPTKTDSNVMWMDEDAAATGSELLAGLERRNEPANGFGFGHSLEMLLRSVEVMRDARVAPAGSPRRLEGRLRVLINDEWAYTSSGLEAISRETIIPINATGWIDGGRMWVGPYTHLSEEARKQADTSLTEALTWIENREDIRILEPGTDPRTTFFRSRN
jgi:hypothetical protein